MRSLSVVPCTIREARVFVGRHHRHHRAPVGALFALAVASAGKVVGVALVGRPVARGLQDGETAEVTRVCVLDGHPNACSKLYGAAWRAARALGWRRLVTYTLPEESGASLRLLGQRGGGSWSCPSRPRTDAHPTQTKLCWEATT